MLDEDVFLRAISVTIDNWPSFQLAISNGMGGPNTAEKVNWMCSMIVDLFKNNAPGSIQIDDVLEYLCSVIDNEFDTIIEDGSAEMVCTSIVGYYNHLTSGRKDFVMTQLVTLVAKQALLKQSQQPQQQRVPSEQSTSAMSSKIADIPEDAEMGGDDEPVDDGWTTVRRKR